jgi:hypothetical protein
MTHGASTRRPFPETGFDCRQIFDNETEVVKFHPIVIH